MLGRRIAVLRYKAGISQAELARRLNLSPSTIGMYEQGRREPPVDILISLSNEFNVSLDYLLTGKDYDSKNQNGNSCVLLYENINHELTLGVILESDLSPLMEKMTFIRNVQLY